MECKYPWHTSLIYKYSFRRCPKCKETLLPFYINFYYDCIQIVLLILGFVFLHISFVLPKDSKLSDWFENKAFKAAIAVGFMH